MNYKLQTFKINKIRGFSLLEILIVIAIISILAVVAMPSYRSYVLRSKRADATNMLTHIANQQIQFFMDNRSYGVLLGNAGLNLAQGTCAANEAISNDDYYCISIVLNGTSSAYTLTATPTAKGGQDQDTDCATITYDSSQTKGSTGGGNCWGN